MNWLATIQGLIVDYYTLIESDINNIDFYIRALEYELSCADVSRIPRSWDWLKKLNEIKNFYCIQLRSFFETYSLENFLSMMRFMKMQAITDV